MHVDRETPPLLQVYPSFSPETSSAFGLQCKSTAFSSEYLIIYKKWKTITRSNLRSHTMEILKGWAFMVYIQFWVLYRARADLNKDICTAMNQLKTGISLQAREKCLPARPDVPPCSSALVTHLLTQPVLILILYLYLLTCTYIYRCPYLTQILGFHCKEAAWKSSVQGLNSFVNSTLKLCGLFPDFQNGNSSKEMWWSLQVWL